MTTYEKKIKISSILLIEDIFILLQQLLKNAGLKFIKKHDIDYLTAQESTMISSLNLIFIPTMEELSGKRSDVHDRLINIQQDGYDKVYVVSINKKGISDYFKENLLSQFPNVKFEFWEVQNIINKIDNWLPEYWSHNDSFIKPYEEWFLKELEEDYELKALKIDKKYLDMLNIFIEPRLSIIINDDKDDSLVFTKTYNRDKLISGGNYVLSGDAGTGKSTLEKRIAKEIIQNNTFTEKKTIPVLIKQIDIIESGDDIIKAIDNQLLNIFDPDDLRKIYKDYKILILVDSIDEFNTEKKEAIIRGIQKLAADFDVRYVISTRDHNYLLEDISIDKGFERIKLENFNLRQAKQFLEQFFKFDFNKSNKLLESLTNNKILDKLAVTPLTLSLISILFEEKQYEIPATITDIYDSFKIILLGRTTVRSSLDFLDITVKERLLSLYALYLLETEERKPKTTKEFENFIVEFLKSKSSSYDKNAIPDILRYFTKEIDILFIEDNQYVKFKHDSFMEYFAALEIFNQKRGLEDLLIDRFTELNWQNTSIFYAGRSKDMPDFLKKMTAKISDYNKITDLFIAGSGFGYLLQALYLTDENIRKEAVKEAVKLNLKLYEKINVLASDKSNFFESMSIPHIAALTSIVFLHNYDSLTLKGAITRAFDELMKEYIILAEKNSDNATSICFQMFNLAVTLHSDRINDQSKILELFEARNILTYPLMVILFDKILDWVNPTYGKRLKDEGNIENRKIRYIKAVNHYIKTPAKDLRFTRFDNIGPIKKVKIYTEGETDPVLIDKAYSVLTDGQSPYWEIKPAGNEKVAGASTLSKMLSAYPPPDGDDIVIGIFDNDCKGIQEFESLKEISFERKNSLMKKHRKCSIYAIKLPIPPGKEVFKQDKNEFMFFELEHYFTKEFLEANQMIKDTSIPEIFEIKGSKKAFSQKVKEQKDVALFEDFKCLFQLIDSICNETTEFV